ncbi:MAG: pyridoxal-dependent decarboxylase, partial [Methylovulum sp.]
MNRETFTLKAVKSPAEKHREPSSNHYFIFNDKNLNHYQDSLLQGIALIQKSLSAAGKPFSGILPQELAAQFNAIDLDQAHDRLADALAEIEELYLNHAVYFHHPHYVAHLNCPIAIPAILAELLLTSINSSVDTWDQSAGGTLIEQKLVDWTAEKIGLGTQAD